MEDGTIIRLAAYFAIYIVFMKVSSDLVIGVVIAAYYIMYIYIMLRYTRLINSVKTLILKGKVAIRSTTYVSVFNFLICI